MGGISTALGAIPQAISGKTTGALQTFGTQGVIPTLTGGHGLASKLSNVIGPEQQQNTIPVTQGQSPQHYNMPTFNPSIFSGLDLNHYAQQGGPMGINFMSSPLDQGPSSSPSTIVPKVDN